MSNKKKVIDKKLKMNAAKYMKEHSDLTYEKASRNHGVFISSLHRWNKAYSLNQSKEMFLGVLEIIQVMKQKKLSD